MLGEHSREPSPVSYDVIVVGGGIAGLTAAAYLSQAGKTVLVCEKEKKVGGLVNSFDYKGFSFEGGIRAIENSGIVMPMLRQLGIHINFVKNEVSIGIEKKVVNLVSEDSLRDYQELLNSQFPESVADIQRIIDDIKRVMKYMDVLYGIDNPLFMDLKKDREYILKTLFPWMFKFIFTINKINSLNTPIDEYLHGLTDNQVLIDMIAQHFFQKTPAFFALSYFSLYLDYQYPKGGNGTITETMERFIIDHQGVISTDTQIARLDPAAHEITDTAQNRYRYKKIIWAADLKKLYQMAELGGITKESTKQRILAQKAKFADKIGGDSVFTLYLTVDLDKSFFEKICGAHFFYTPHKKGLFACSMSTLMDEAQHVFTADEARIRDWLRDFLLLTTYEISFPVMRDLSLAPEGKTGLIISTLFDHALTKHIQQQGWYEAFKDFCAQEIIDVLEDSIFTGMKSKIIDRFTSTPLTLEQRTGNSEGAITGWAFTNSSIPVIKTMTKVAQSVVTPIPDVIQAGQWAFSPSGLPMSILTGKLAADRAKQQLKSK